MIASGSWLWALRRDVAREQRVRAIATESRTIDPGAIIAAARVMKLATMEIDTFVRIEKTDESWWRGDVKASLETPVRLVYGSDLTGLSPERVRTEEVAPGRWRLTLTIPRPEKLYVETFPRNEKGDVSPDGVRARVASWVLSEGYLTEPRRDVPDIARKLSPTASDRRRIDEGTREQVAAFVRAVLGAGGGASGGKGVEVVVQYPDEHGDAQASEPSP
jgi:hypothetical protein